MPLATTENVHGILDIFAKTARKSSLSIALAWNGTGQKKGDLPESRLEKKSEQTPSQLLFDARWTIG